MTTHALISIFSPPSDCLATVYQYSSEGNVWEELGPQPQSATSCYPPSYTAAASFFYSPAFSCPSSYTTAFSTVVTAAIVTETRVTCCPSNFVYQPSRTAVAAFYSTLGCTVPTSAAYSTVLPWVLEGTFGSLVTSTQLVGPGGGENAYSIELHWQASDIVSQATITQILTTTASPTTPPSTTPYSPTSAAQLGGLSTGAKAGIGIGVSLGVIGIAAILALVYVVAKRRASPHYTVQAQPQYGENIKQQPGSPLPEMPDNARVT